jgi:hypothetical protein
MTIVHVHAGPSSLDRFMALAGPGSERFTELLTLRSIDVYGEPTAAALRHLENKARLLSGDVAVHTPHAGFSRLSQR